MSANSPISDPFLSRRTGGTEVFLIRHGDALPGADELVPSGVYDDQPLSAAGQAQARALGEHLCPLRFAAIYSSPLRRAQETAAFVAEFQEAQVPVALVPDVREVMLGTVRPALPEGATAEEVAAHLRDRLADIVRLVATSGYWSAIPGSEPDAAFRARVTNAIDTLAQRHMGERIAVIAHGGVINAYVAATLGLERSFFFPAANTSISVVRVRGAMRVLLALNDICHLRAAGLLPSQT
jgi:probable phosphoglycerate mutase